MFVRNDRDRRWVNGTLGMIAELEEDAVRVELTDGGDSFWVEAEIWEMNEYVHDSSGGSLNVSVVGTYTQLPLRLGYALTIHRSQGKTLDRVVVDMSRGPFAPGQTYVALSRVRSLDGLVLLRPIAPSDVSVDPAVTRFIQEGVVPTAGQQRLM
jgi:ATP-dependent exoDNAse (exonuclease V) alpha subunit